MQRGFDAAGGFSFRAEPAMPELARNPLRDFFESRREGRGIWKWVHYFDIYDRHFSRFRGQKVHVVEIGIYSGGSLDMWREYFGPQSRIYGVDIEQGCAAYDGGSVQVFIGDQADRDFWRRFRSQVPRVDVVIDDGGHLPEQQIVTLEELLPHLHPGGVYLCEDVHGSFNGMAAYVQGLSHQLNDITNIIGDESNPERRLVCGTNSFQSAIDSIHLYPYVTVIERTRSLVPELVAPKHGTVWEPFLT